MGLNNLTHAEEAIHVLKQALGLDDTNFVHQSIKRCKLLVPRSERYEYVKRIQQLDEFEYDPNVKGSSIGGIKYKDSLFLLKPSNAQGRSSAGTENEDILENEINQYIQNGVNKIIFTSPLKQHIIENVNDVVGTGYDVAGGKKADLIIKSTHDYPISIKKDNAGFWESSDTRYKSVVNKLVQKISDGDFAPELVFKPFIDKLGNEKIGINTMHNDVTGEKVTGIIVTGLPTNDEESIIFGADKAVVVYRSFSPSDFTREGNTLYIESSKIIEDMDDVIHHQLEPILNIRHDSTRTSTGGLRATIQPENKIYSEGKLTGNKIELSYASIML